jgi:hypothetical protein
MLLLIFISSMGLVLSAVIHFSSLFHIYEAPSWLIMLMNTSMIIVFYPVYIISKKTVDEGNIKDFKKAASGVCPDWLLVTNGFIIMYALGWLIFFIFKRYFYESVITNWQRIMTNSGFWIAYYSLVFALLYSCRRLKKRPLINGD